MRVERRLAAATALAFALTLALPQAQARRPEVGTGLIVGQVVDGRSGRPVSGAIVGLGGAGAGRPRILTGSTGRFVFRDLPRGYFTIVVSKPGYAGGAYGRRRPGGPSRVLPLGPDERVGDAVVAVWKHAAIGGRVVDESGEPVVRVQLRAWRRAIVAGNTRLALAGTTLTDDRGNYRLGSLLPGDYVVAASAHQVVVPAGIDTTEWGASALQGPGLVYRLGGGTVTPPPPGDRFSLYPPSYYAGAVEAAHASLVSVGSGDERLSVDLQVHPVPAARVSGTLVSPAGPAAYQTVRLVAEDAQSTPVQEDAPTTVSNSIGAFVFPAVPPGRYVLRSTTSTLSSVNPGGEMVWAAMPLQVGSTDIDGLTVSLLPALRISGRVEFDGRSPWPSPAQVARIPLLVEPADGDGELGPIPLVRANAEGEFTSTGLAGGRYVLRVTDSPAGWMFKSASYGGRDISSSPVELNGYDAGGVVVTFTDRWSAVSGMVLNASQNFDADALVVLFTTDRQLWTGYGLTSRRVRGVRSGRRGEYVFNSVPPGEYYLAAIADDKADGWQDPVFLERLSRGSTRVRVADGETRRQDLRTRELR